MPGEPGSLSPADFVAKWQARTLSERAASQTHFIELCRMLGVPAPYDDRNDDANYCFDALTAAAGSHLYAPRQTNRARKQAAKHTDPNLFAPPSVPSATPPASSAIIPSPEKGRGFADVWKRGHFCWEYKRQGRDADLDAALRQLKEYKDSLDNPPLLIVCDIDHFEIHTNFTGHPTTRYAFGLQGLADAPAEWREGRGVSPLAVLRYAFTDPEWFRPKQKNTDITEEFAAKIGELAAQIAARKSNDPHAVAHFLMQVVFALFAEDIGLLPKDLVTRVIQANVNNAARFKTQMRTLFRVMEKGGDFGVHGVPEFNGGLFQNLDAQPIPDLKPGEIGLLSVVAQQDWSAVEPSILGTLFERSLDPNKRAQIGAHYTSRDDIMLIVEPVILAILPRAGGSPRARPDSDRSAPAFGDHAGSPSAAAFDVPERTNSMASGGRRGSRLAARSRSRVSLATRAPTRAPRSILAERAVFGVGGRVAGYPGSSRPTRQSSSVGT